MPRGRLPPFLGALGRLGSADEPFGADLVITPGEVLLLAGAVDKLLLSGGIDNLLLAPQPGPGITVGDQLKLSNGDLLLLSGGVDNLLLAGNFP